VALARALAREPAVLLLDEPFSAVDQVTRHDLYAELAALRRSLEMPIVLVTHDLPEARTLADRLVILDGGTTLQAGEPTHVLSHPRNARVAALLGLRNHFNGVFRRRDGEHGELEWTTPVADGSATTLRVVDKGRIDDGAAVTWIVSGEHLHLQIGSSAQNDENTVACEVVDLLPLGDLTRCTLCVPGAGGPHVVLALPTSHVRRGGVAVGASGTLTLDAEGIHVMPVHGGV
jgi:molybdate transport system ATP-binding protein